MKHVENFEKFGVLQSKYVTFMCYVQNDKCK
jgi:hypothetical protein